MAKKRKSANDRERIQALIEEATVDCHDEEEQHSGVLNMVLEEVVCPFRAKVVGEEVEVTDFECPQSGYQLYAVCQRKGKKHKVDIGSPEWTTPRPEGFPWIEAYLAWREGMDALSDEDEK